MSDTDWTKIAPDSQLRFRIACFTYCLGDECGLSEDVVSLLVERILDRKATSAYQRWILELYTESPSSFAEGRAVLAQLLQLMTGFRQTARVRKAMICQLPARHQATAESHPLMTNWKPIRLASEDTGFRRFRHAIGLGREYDIRDFLPQIERESAFNTFLEIPGFREAFERFWHQPPKHRDNLRTRVLVVLAGILASTIELQTDEQRSTVKRRIEQECHTSSQTASDILDIASGLHAEQLPVTELGERLIADAADADRKNFWALLQIISDSPQVSEGKRERAATLHNQLKPFLR